MNTEYETSLPCCVNFIQAEAAATPSVKVVVVKAKSPVAPKKTGAPKKVGAKPKGATSKAKKVVTKKTPPKKVK